MDSSTSPELPERLRHLADLAAQGLTDKEIAARLEISVHTGDAHWRRLRERYGAASRAQVMAMVTVEAAERRLAGLEAQRQQMEGEIEALQQKRETMLNSRREQLKHLVQQQNEILWTMGELMIEDDVWERGTYVFRTPDAFLGAAPGTRRVNLRACVVAGTSEVRPEGVVVDGVRFEGCGEDAYRLMILHWPHLCAGADEPVVWGDRPDGRPTGGIRIIPPSDVHFLGFAFQSLTHHAPVADAWRFAVETEERRFDLVGTCDGATPGYLGVQTGSPIRSVAARCGDVCYPLIAHVAYAGMWSDGPEGRTTAPVGP